jgi:hypothetical protein
LAENEEIELNMVVETATDTKVEALRAELPAVHTTAYFNTGSNGPIPRIVYQAVEAEARRELERGRIVPGAYEGNRERNRHVAALAAGIFGADADEIALTHSASEGLNAALMGIEWDAGDEVVTTSEEHPGLLLPLSLLAYRQGVVTRYADLCDGRADVVEALARQITSRTRVIAVSHVLWSTGAVLPLREICDLARKNELLVIVRAEVALRSRGDGVAVCPSRPLPGLRADLRAVRAVRNERLLPARRRSHALRDRRVLQSRHRRAGGGAAVAAGRGRVRMGLTSRTVLRVWMASPS